jgi:sortase A
MFLRFLHNPAFKRTRDSFILLALFALLIGALFIFRNDRYDRVSGVVLPAPVISGPSVQVDPLNVPERVIIPSIEVNAAVQHVGTTEAGTMQAPTYYKDVSWFKLGAAPGEVGNSVIAGHYDTKNGKDAVFKNLRNLAVGEEIIVRNEKGESVRFVVKESVLVDYENPPREILERVFGPSQSANLVLITCDGTWLEEEKTYTDRLIVFAEFTGRVE